MERRRKRERRPGPADLADPQHPAPDTRTDTQHPTPDTDPDTHPTPDTPPVLVSACLAGLRTRHDGRSKTDPRIAKMVRRGEAIPVCPEQLGGLTTPREEAAFVDPEQRRLKTRSGQDVTRQFRRGAEEVARLAQAVGAREAILKERSPSCGTHLVYQRQPDGSERVVLGQGVTARRLAELGVRLRSEEEVASDE